MTEPQVPPINPTSPIARAVRIATDIRYAGEHLRSESRFCDISFEFLWVFWEFQRINRVKMGIVFFKTIRIYNEVEPLMCTHVVMVIAVWADLEIVCKGLYRDLCIAIST